MDFFKNNAVRFVMGNCNYANWEYDWRSCLVKIEISQEKTLLLYKGLKG